MPQDETGERYVYHVQRSLLYTHEKSANISTKNNRRKLSQRPYQLGSMLWNWTKMRVFISCNLLSVTDVSKSISGIQTLLHRPLTKFSTVKQILTNCKDKEGRKKLTQCALAQGK